MILMLMMTLNVTTMFVVMNVSSHVLMMMLWLMMLWVMNVTALSMMLCMMSVMFHLNLLKINAFCKKCDP